MSPSRRPAVRGLAACRAWQPAGLAACRATCDILGCADRSLRTCRGERVIHATHWVRAAAAFLALTSAASAHHSYAMFDGSKTVTVKGFVAKLDWTNPHVFIWLHVPNPKAASGYDLYAFENGSTNVLARRGWSPKTFKV